MNKNSFWFKLLMTGILFLTIYFVYLGFKERQRKQKIERQINFLQEEANKINKNNDELSKQIQFLNTDEYKEQIAKEKLNLKKKGEKVVIIQSDELEENKKNENENNSNDHNYNLERKMSNSNLENYQKWWNYFFNKNKNE